MTGEGSGKLLSHLSSKSTGSNPSSTISLACGGINDAAFCPDGGRLAVACRDGSVRLLEWPSGACLGGYQVCVADYYICCSKYESVPYYVCCCFDGGRLDLGM
jgi:WD40 repeat protein